MIGKKKIKNKNAQVTIFVIIGILIVVLIVLFFYLTDNSKPKIITPSETNSMTVFESCLEDDLYKTIEIISLQGGYLNNTLNISFLFKDSKQVQDISYLCYTYQSYFSCKNQEPLLMNHLEKEIERGISENVEECFYEMIKSLEKQGENIDAVYEGFNIKLMPKKISVNLKGSITSTNLEQTSKQIEMTGNFPSRLYEITKVVEEIVNQEGTYCNFDLLGFMLIYPEFKIDKTSTRNSTTIYTIEHKNGVERFDFAIRSCAIPPAF